MKILDFEFESDDVLFIGFCGWLGALWSMIAFAVSVIWDLDQSWYSPERVPDLVLVSRIALFWPVWGGVQAENALGAVGLHVGAAWPVLLFVAGVVPAVLAGVIWTWWTRRAAVAG